MAIISYIVDRPFQTVVALLLLVPVYPILAWLLDEHGLRSIPGPKLAALSDAWLGYWAAQGCRSEHVHDMHLKYGARISLYSLDPSHCAHRQVRTHCTRPCIH
jgi:benzoate 4-monooxygenase